MTSTASDEIKRTDRTVTAFLDEWVLRTKRRHAVGDSLDRLRRIVSPDVSSTEQVSARLAALAEWLDRYGEAVVDEGVRRSELEALVESAEQFVQLREGRVHPDTAERSRADQLLDRLVHVIRGGTKRLGLEYTPAGLVEAPGEPHGQSERVRRSLLERLSGFEDIKAAYQKTLEFQKERLDYFYQEDTHLLSVLDYQLKNLEARPNPDDEFFAMCLINFLRQHNYQVTPYVRRFRSVAAGGLTPTLENTDT